jgi:Flp pilus assembly protein TadG
MNTMRSFMERAKIAATERIRCCGQGEEGSTLVEMAFVLPIMLIILTGVFSFGIILNQYLVLTNSVNNGARAFAMSAGQDGSTSMMNSGDPCKYAASTIQTGSSNLAASNLNLTITYGSYSGSPSGTAAVTTYTGTASSWPSCSGLKMYGYDYVTIQATYPVTPLLFGRVSSAMNLTSSSTELVQ